MPARKSQGNKKSPAGQLRIVAGNWRSRLLRVADVPGLRPTSERIRETLFNWLAPKVHGAVCLDLCSGTGALGIEALSRGAKRAVFVEQSPAAVDMLQYNVDSLGSTAAEIIKTDARDYLAGHNVEAFDVVFMDPPFAAELHHELCRLLEARDWLSESARIYIEMGKGQPSPDLPRNWTVLKDNTAGSVRYLLATVER